MIEKPFPESYWVIPRRFLAGGYPTSTQSDEILTRQHLTALLNAGITTFFDLTREGELPSYLSTLREEAARFNVAVDYKRQPIQDRGLPSKDQMVFILNDIDEALAAGRKIYLHCHGGIGRTGTAVGCWLIRHGLDGEAAFTRLNSLFRTAEQSNFFPRSPEMDAQVLFILDWKESTPAVHFPFSISSKESDGGEE